MHPNEVEELLIKRGVKAIPRKSAEILLDFDTTDDPLHGRQEGGYFNGYYRHYCYLPLYCFCGNIPSTDVAGESNLRGARGAKYADSMSGCVTVLPTYLRSRHWSDGSEGSTLNQSRDAAHP